MTDVVVVYWRDIPAQLIAGRGRAAVKAQLPMQFEQAIDRAAMRAGLAGTDAYLGEWHRSTTHCPEDGAEAAIAGEMSRLCKIYDTDRLRQLIENAGRMPAPVA